MEETNELTGRKSSKEIFEMLKKNKIFSKLHK